MKNTLILSSICWFILSCNNSDNSPVPLASNWLACAEDFQSDVYGSCTSGNTDQLTVWTWNIENFPVSNRTQQSVIDILDAYQPDVVAVQEIKNVADFEEIVLLMENYEGQVVNVSGSIELGFIYNSCRITSTQNAGIILDGPVEPRPAVNWEFTYQNETFHIINIHLKCCDDGETRRLNSIESLKTYMDENLSTENAILLGDFNDEILDDALLPFYADSTNYYFSDLEVERAASTEWSYPSWPSHLDHIMVNQPLIDRVSSSRAIKIENCNASYFSTVSDHRPVEVTFNP